MIHEGLFKVCPHQSTVFLRYPFMPMPYLVVCFKTFLSIFNLSYQKVTKIFKRFKIHIKYAVLTFLMNVMLPNRNSLVKLKFYLYLLCFFKIFAAIQ